MTRKRRRDTVAPPSGPPPAGRSWFGLYRGEDVGPHGASAPSWTGPEGSMLVLGPPRSGKTTSLVVPAVLDAPAAVVSTSTKPDVLMTTVARRHLVGNPLVFDPTGKVVISRGAYFARWSPVVGCHEFERAVAMAHALASAARPASALTESAHWVERAEALLAPLLFAAAFSGADMAALCRWVLSRDLREPLAVLEASGHEMAQAVIAGVAGTEDRERSGIFSSAAGLLSAYRSEKALATTVDPNFDPAVFARSTDALYICAPSQAQEQLAPIVVALLEQIRAAVYARPHDAAPVVFALDEVANIAPLPSLPSLAAEGAGQGLVTLACLQDLSQARARWGAEAEGFFSLFGTKVVFPGIGDQRTLSLISTLAGEQPVLLQSRTSTSFLAAIVAGNATPPTTTRSITWRPSLPPDEVARGRPGHVLSLSGSAMRWLGVVPWQRHPMWARVADAQAGIGNERLRPAEYYYPENVPVPDHSAAAAKPGYRGPRVVNRARGSWVWIDDGTVPASERFAAPEVLHTVLPASRGSFEKATAPLDASDPSPGASTHDPLFDKPVKPESPEWLRDIPLPRGVEDLEDLRFVFVRVLGPVQVDGWLNPPERALVTELACYLALHRNQRFSGDQLRFALRPEAESELSAKTLRTYISMLRKSLGPDYVLSGGDGYGVPWFVDTDFALFERQCNDDKPAEDNMFLLDNIRGRPFEGVPTGTYEWVFSELWISQIETTIVSTVQRFTNELLEAELIDKAEHCVRQGLLGVPQDLSLWERRLEVARGFGPGALDRAKEEASAALGSDARALLLRRPD